MTTKTRKRVQFGHMVVTYKARGLRNYAYSTSPDNKKNKICQGMIRTANMHK